MEKFEINKNHISIVDMYKIGVGPSSSHTVGPMLAGWMFGNHIIKHNIANRIKRIKVYLYGSLALTGKGHLTDVASIIGLSGYKPENIESHKIPVIIEKSQKEKQLLLMKEKNINFSEKNDIIWNYEIFLPEHPNGLKFEAIDQQNNIIHSATYFSTGGGFVIKGGCNSAYNETSDKINPKYPYHSANELLLACNKNKISIAELQRENEKAWRNDDETLAFIDKIAEIMFSAIENGIKNKGILPGGLNIKRRANSLFNDLTKIDARKNDPLNVMDWVNLYALAVSEENAGCSRVITAPTNGAAGVIPAVLKYYQTFYNSTKEGIREFLLTAGAIGTLYKKRASLSAAEVGCQGEVGVACSMAAAGLTAVLGGTNKQIENAAEIGMEHNLGLTCDPIKGLVQVPCIERNTMGAIKAINASKLALKSSGEHFVSLDSVIETMRQTGNDMKKKYKETSLGGLASNTIEC